jgi:hypothetical protein
MCRLFERYAEHKSVGVCALRFLRKGDRIMPGQTPNMLKLDDQDEIECVAEPPVPGDVWEALKRSSRAANALHVGDDQTRGDTNNASTPPADSSATNTTMLEPCSTAVDTSHARTGRSSQSCTRNREKDPSKEPPNPKPPLADNSRIAIRVRNPVRRFVSQHD